jgi:hypothetical protein
VTKRLLCVHVGASKTGTSALQRGLRDSQKMLRATGIGSPFPGRHSSVRRLLRPLGWVAGSGFVQPVEPTVVDDLAAAMRGTAGERLLISNEDLCELDPERISMFMEAADAADLDVALLLTGRDWGKQLPSEWQQFLKHRLTVAYPDFLDQVRRREGLAAEHFWQRQDYAGICQRWGATLDPARVHVIPVPSMAQDPEGVFRLFADVVGFDATALVRPTRAVNPSFGYVEAEVLRRLNVALGKRLPNYEDEYAPAVRRVLVKQVLAREASGRITLPPEHLDWVRELDQQRVDDLLSRGYQVHGDPKLLVTPADSARPLPVLDEDAIAAAAVKTLAHFVVRSFRDRTAGATADADV